MNCTIFSAWPSVGAHKEEVLSGQSKWSNRILRQIIIDFQISIFQVILVLDKEDKYR